MKNSNQSVCQKYQSLGGAEVIFESGVEKRLLAEKKIFFRELPNRVTRLDEFSPIGR
jgi:hypothetical protein